ncbi:hypothetical protein SAMN04489761_1104 [Tenacibaculum sp. MAR_2009_124]|nr:hypothetical protein SAMN04489761_1104 [Tenacibaculum sp. MAR_2009_124]
MRGKKKPTLNRMGNYKKHIAQSPPDFKTRQMLQNLLTYTIGNNPIKSLVISLVFYTQYPLKYKFYFKTPEMYFAAFLSFPLLLMKP